MAFVIMDSTGNALDSFEERDAALAGLRALALDDPCQASDLALLTFDDQGHATDEAVVVADVVPEVVSELAMVGDGWTHHNAVTLIRWSEAAQTPVLANA